MNRKGCESQNPGMAGPQVVRVSIVANASPLGFCVLVGPPTIANASMMLQSADEAAPHTTLRPPYLSLNYIYSEYIVVDTV